MKRWGVVVVSVVVGALSVACGGKEDVAASSAAANVFRNETSTKAGKSTWDSDLVNIDRLAPAQTGAGVYVAVLDTGLVPNWRDFFPAARVATELGTGFDQPVTFGTVGGDPCALGATVGKLSQSTWVGSTGSTHGTHVASTILGYSYRSNFDAAAGMPLPPIQVRGIAPEVTVIPVRVLADYQLPSRPKCPTPIAAQRAVFGTSDMIAAGIDYVTGLANRGIKPIVINMSLGGPGLDAVEKEAIDRAIAAGVIIVAAAGNDGTAGMDFPGAYAPVISAGAAGWISEWRFPANAGKPPVAPEARDRLWWLQSEFYPFVDVRDPTNASDVYVADFSSRAVVSQGQQLDVLAPGSWVRGPFEGDPGFNHLPWFSKGIGDLVGGNGSNFFFVGGTSMATPHVASIAAIMLQASSSLRQADVERILKSTALPIPASGSMVVHDSGTGFETISWDTGTAARPLDAVGAGLVQADAAVAASR